jgi:6-pyruvoyltetrahydropterin/6-carboxytetrahydropterin synthase
MHPPDTGIVRIAKSFHWEMAHRLPYHTAGCQNVHGHSYELRVALSGHPDERGMVMDYGELKAIVQPMVDELDHAFLCSTDDSLMVEFLQRSSLKVVYVEFPTTAENLVYYFLDRIHDRLKDRTNLAEICVRVCETRATYAEAARMLRSL